VFLSNCLIIAQKKYFRWEIFQREPPQDGSMKSKSVLSLLSYLQCKGIDKPSN